MAAPPPPSQPEPQSQPLLLRLLSLKHTLSCSLCHGILQNPACLPCKHHFCMSCLLKSMMETSACPKCKARAPTQRVHPSPDVYNIVDAFLKLETLITESLLADSVRSEEAQLQNNSGIRESRLNLKLEDECVNGEVTRQVSNGSRESVTDGSLNLTEFPSRKRESSCLGSASPGMLPAAKRLQLPRCPTSMDGVETKVLNSEDKWDAQTGGHLLERCENEENLLAEEYVKERLASEEKTRGAMKNESSFSKLQFDKSPNPQSVKGLKFGEEGQAANGNFQLTASVSKVIDSNTEKSACAFCHKSDHPIAGSMIRYKKGIVFNIGRNKTGQIFCVHRNCAEWAPGVYYVDNVAKNVQQEVARGYKIKCHVCGLRGAVLGCYVKRCRKSFHYPCAHSLPCRWDTDNFLVLCPEHVGSKFPGEGVKGSKSRNLECNTPEADANNSSECKPETPVPSAELFAQNQSNVYVPIMTDSTPNDQSVHSENEHEIINVKAKERTAEHSAKWPTSKCVLCGSGMSPKANELLAAFVRRTGVTLQREWAPCVTHLIVGTDEIGAARRTFKYMMATLQGKWILKVDWLSACMAVDTFVNEEPYEVSIDSHGMIGGPRHARGMALAKACRLFAGLRFYILGNYPNAYKSDLQALMMAGGGEIVTTISANSELLDCKSSIVVYSMEVCGDESMYRDQVIKSRYLEAKSFAEKMGAKVVGHTWILDSVVAYELQPFP